MKLIKYLSIIFTLSVLFCMCAFAKTHKTDIIATDTIEYTLGEKDLLSCELCIEEDGLYNVKVLSLESPEFTPEIGITILQKTKEVYSFNAKKRLSDFEETQGEYFEFITGLTQGEYKVVIENLTKFSDVSFKIETVFTNQKNIEGFKSDTFESATKINLNTKYHGGTSTTQEKDFFCFEMPYDGYAFIEMYSPELKHFTLYDENKNEIGSIGIEIDEPDKIYELRSGLKKGKYYISVFPEENHSSPLYTVKVIAQKGELFEKEYNNEALFATAIEEGKEYQGNLFGIDDRDIFTFSLPKESRVTLDFTDTIVSKDGHYKISLSDGKSTLFSSDECGRESKTLKLPKGTYFFTVSSLGYKQFTSMAYKIRFSSETPFVTSPPEAGNTQTKPENTEVVQFSDVSKSSWFANDLLEARKKGLIEGIEGNIYNPNGNVTVAEAITMAARLYSANTGKKPDSTLNGGKWYTQYVSFAIDAGLIEKGDFKNYDSFATRAEIANIFSSLFPDKQTKEIIRLPDVDENTKYYKDIYKLYRIGIFKGNDKNGTFYPDANLTRAEAAVILLRIHNTI